MRAALITTAVAGAVLLLLAAAAAWFVSYPFRLLSRMAGVKPVRRSNRTIAALALESSLALALGAFGLRRAGKTIGPSWHPCEECGQPIDKPSTAHFCSEACRRSSRIRQRAAIEGVASYE